ncbi:MAG: hypothetical protein ACXW32_01570 [Limisphaerales bacterium]
MKWVLIILLTAISALPAEVIYQSDFQKAELGSAPMDFLIVEGDFTVKEEGSNKFLELPGAPLDSFSFLFGPKQSENVVLQARIFATAKGRRYPVFDIGLNGLGGYKLRVTPAKKQLELYRGDAQKAAVPYTWTAGKWTQLKLQVTKPGDGEWKIEGKAWSEGEKEPAEPLITFTDTQAPQRERASAGAMPYSGTPILFDDLTVCTVAK